MLTDGALVNVFLGTDRHLYIDTSPGDVICTFRGRTWMRDGKDNILSITEIPDKYDDGECIPPPGWEVQGLD